MRPDQEAKLEALQEKLIDVVIDEVNPDNWPEASNRGDRFWEKRGAAATFALIDRIADLRDRHLKNTSKDEDTQKKRDDDLDKQIKAREREAQERMEAVLNKAKAVPR